MKQRKLLPGILAAAGMLLLILDSKTALVSAAEGIELCIQTVIPSLFPFFLLSGILVSSFLGSRGSLLRPLGRLLGMPAGSESLLICGFLGGYPVGAKSVRDAWAGGTLSKSDAERLLPFCNNAGPSFLFGMAAPMFSDLYTGWILWAIQIASALTAGILLKEEPAIESPRLTAPGTSVLDSLNRALSVTAQICGWVIFFRVGTGFLSRWFLWKIPQWMQTAVIGLLELANGCLMLPNIRSEEIRFLLCSAMLSFGGVCVWMQTASAAKGLSLRYYRKGKLLQNLCCFLYSLLWLINGTYLLVVFPAILLGSKIIKKSGNPQTVGV